MQVISLSSGSHGNACLVQTVHGAFLVDAGLPMRTLLARCAMVGTQPADIRGIVLTHEHGDHTTSVAPLMRRLNIPLLTMPATHASLQLPTHASFIPLASDATVECHGVIFRACPVSHDAVAPLAVCINDGINSVAIATDLGQWDEELVCFMQAAALIVIEANHDRERLRLSRYDAQLKLRIASKTGHLDNLQAGAFLAEVARDGRVRDAWLAHLSQEANSADLAVKSVHNVLAMKKRQRAYRSITALPHHRLLVWGDAQQTTQQSFWHDD